MKYTKTQRVQNKQFDQFRKETGIGITYAMTGKMLGFISLSTSNERNPLCEALSKDLENVCAKCYARTNLKIHPELRRKLEGNHVLYETVIPVKKWVKINANAYKLFRFEAFGDVRNVIQAINYFNFAKANPKVTFAAWTKQPQIYEAAIEMGHEKPDNFLLIYSSPRLNHEENVDRFKSIDKTFTVYTYDYLQKENAGSEFINCGSRSCKQCRRCYTHGNGGVEHVHEILKQDSAKVHKMWNGKQN